MLCIFFFNDTATTEIYTLSLHDALPIFLTSETPVGCKRIKVRLVGKWSFFLRQQKDLLPEVGHLDVGVGVVEFDNLGKRSEEHTSELQLRQYLVCRLLLEKKKNNTQITF